MHSHTSGYLNVSVSPGATTTRSSICSRTSLVSCPWHPAADLPALRRRVGGQVGWWEPYLTSRIQMEAKKWYLHHLERSCWVESVITSVWSAARNPNPITQLSLVWDYGWYTHKTNKINIYYLNICLHCHTFFEPLFGMWKPAFQCFCFNCAWKGPKCPLHSPEKLSNFTVGQPTSLRFTKSTCQSL